MEWFGNSLQELNNRTLNRALNWEQAEDGIRRERALEPMMVVDGGGDRVYLYHCNHQHDFHNHANLY